MTTHESKPPTSGPGKDEHPTVHVYDGDLVEEDNVLPLWWLYTLYGAVAFAAVYWYGEHELKAWQSRATSHQEEMALVRLEQAKKGNVSSDTILALAKTPSQVDKGREVFTTTCVSCHRADGGGNIGPNLTDSAWLHGGSPAEVYTTVRDGFAQKGMPAWGAQLGDEKVLAVAAYVVTLKDTNVSGGKAPQGIVAASGKP